MKFRIAFAAAICMSVLCIWEGAGIAETAETAEKRQNKIQTRRQGGEQSNHGREKREFHWNRTKWTGTVWCVGVGIRRRHFNICTRRYDKNARNGWNRTHPLVVSRRDRKSISKQLSIIISRKADDLMDSVDFYTVQEQWIQPLKCYEPNRFK